MKDNEKGGKTAKDIKKKQACVARKGYFLPGALCLPNVSFLWQKKSIIFKRTKMSRYFTLKVRKKT